MSRSTERTVPVEWLTEDPKDPAYHWLNKPNNDWRKQADAAKTWAELPSAYREMVLAELGDYGAYCGTREEVHVKMFEGSRAKELARKALKQAAGPEKKR